MKHILLILLTAGALALAGCGQKAADKAPEKIVNITTATVRVKDLPVTESAVGNATALGVAQALDPNQVRRGSLTIRLPFPEQVARQLRPGQAVRLTSFNDPGKAASARVREIRAPLDSSTQTMEVIAELAAASGWATTGSVRGEVVVGVHRNALMIPEQAVVLRPAGSVVYVPDSEGVAERVVRTGLTRDGEMEILSGLKAGETVVVDGAGLLSGGAKVRVMTATPAAGVKP